MKLAINTAVIGKPTTDDQKKIMTFTYKNVDVDMKQLVEYVEKGYSFCAQHKNNHRKSGNFVCSDVIAVDIDSGLRLDEAMSDPFVQQYASIIYTTESHTEEAHRFRIIFCLDKTITTAADMKLAYTGVTRKFGGDASCTDACRQFYGSTRPNTQLLGHTIPFDVLEQIITMGNESGNRQDSVENEQNVPASIVSRLCVDADDMVRGADGKLHRLGNVPLRTAIYCPMHVDTRPSAFVVKSKAGVVGIHCSSCAATYFTSSDVPLYNFNYRLWNVTQRLLKNHIDYEEDEFFISNCPSNMRIDEPYLPDLIPDTTFTLVKSPKGTGKTEWLKRIVKRCKTQWINDDAGQEHNSIRRKRSVLLIGHRKSLILASASRLGLVPYNYTYGYERAGIIVDREMQNKPTRYYAICADSLSTLLNPKRDKYDVILIDEVEQVLAHLTGGTVKDRRMETVLFLKHYLNAAKEVYALDADLNELTVNTLTNFLTDKKKTVTLIINDYTPKERTLYLYDDKLHLVNELLGSIERKEKCFVCSNSKTQVEKLTKMIEDRFGNRRKVISITSSNSQTGEIQKFLTTIKTSILDYDVIIVSPSVGTGVDITFPYNETKIDVVYGFFEARVNTHFDMDQQLSRVRHPGKVNVWISPETFRFSTDPYIIKQEVIQRDNTSRQLIGIEQDGTLKYRTDDEYLDLYADVKAMQRGSKNNLRYHFKKLKEYNGWKIVEIERDDDRAKAGLQHTRRGNYLFEQERVERILSAKVITGIEYQFLSDRKKASTLTQDQEDAMRRYEIESFYLRPVTEELIKRDKKGKLRQQLRNYELYTVDFAECVEKDWINGERVSHATDKKDLSVRSKLLHELMKAAGLADDNSAILVNKVIEGDGLAEFAELCLNNKERIAQLFDIDIRKDVRKKAAQQLGKLLKLMGITWQKVGTTKKEDNKVYRYMITRDVIDELDTVLSRHRDPQLRDQWNMERDKASEGRLFDKGQEEVVEIAVRMRSAS